MSDDEGRGRMEVVVGRRWRVVGVTQSHVLPTT